MDYNVRINGKVQKRMKALARRICLKVILVIMVLKTAQMNFNVYHPF